MAIIISKNGRNATRLNKTDFGLEDSLQQYIHNNPETIPLYDIKDDIQLLILAREFQTTSGPIDAIGIDKDGEIYLVETKLYKNPDKRTVVAQVLDYGASLWKSHPDFDSFLLRIDSAVQETFHQTARERIQSFFSLDESSVEALLLSMAEHLNGGSFKFVVLMDSLHVQLKDLILYMNQNSKFDIYGVELEYYKHDEFEIIIPKLFGAEVKKDIAGSRSDTAFISDQEYISLYKTISLGDKIQEVLSLYPSIQNGEMKFPGWNADRTPKNINFFFKSSGRTKMTLVISIGYNKSTPRQTLDFWLYEKDVEDKVLHAITATLGIPAKKLEPEAKFGVVAQWLLRDFTKEKLLKFFETIF